jgi:hypothetical protein
MEKIMKLKTREVWIGAVTGKPVLNDEESAKEEKAEASAEGKQ